MNRLRLASFIALVLALSACKGTTVLVGVESFLRPESIEFACFDEETKTVVALEKCDGEDLRYIHLALVTQWARGQLAAVNLETNLPIDSSKLIPGYTYVNVGVSPTGIVALDPSTSGPAITLIASYGSRRIESVETGTFYPESEPFSEEGLYLRSAVTLPDAPTDLAFLPSDAVDGARGLAIVTLPASSQIATVRVLDDGTLDEGSLTLYAVQDAPLASIGGGTVDESAPYERICPLDRAPELATADARDPLILGPAAPHRLKVDLHANPPTILVADSGVPFLHRFEFDGTALIEIEAIATQVPLLDLDLTRPLGETPDDAPDAEYTARILYGIDASDRSVLAIDYDASSPSFGDTLAASAGEGAADRIFIRGAASRIAIIEPGLRDALDPASASYGICPPSEHSRAQEARPNRLRGVFLSVATLAGDVYFVDVWDLDASCRGGLNCAAPARADDQYVAIRRNRQRLGTFSAGAPTVVGTPHLRFGSSPGRIHEDGDPGSGGGAPLIPFAGGCPDETKLLQAYPSSELFPNRAPLICLSSDPWSGAIQRFSARWEAPIPGTTFGAARLTSQGGLGTLSVQDFDFCRAGVLGADNILNAGLAEDEPEAGYGGDFIDITSALPRSRAGDAECAPFLDNTVDARSPILLRVLHSSRGELTLGDGPVYTVDEVARCFDQPLGGVVRVRDAYFVRGSVSGFEHRVIEGSGGRCEIDTSNHPFDPLDAGTARNFRAIEGKPFIHPLIAFTIGPPLNADPAVGLAPGTEIDAELIVDVGRIVPPLQLPTRGNIRDLAFSPIDQRLYAVDTANNTLLKISLDGVEITHRID